MICGTDFVKPNVSKLVSGLTQALVNLLIIEAAGVNCIIKLRHDEHEWELSASHWRMERFRSNVRGRRRGRILVGGG